VHVADHHSSAMHGATSILHAGYAGTDDDSLYCRLDFTQAPSYWAAENTQLVVSVESPEATGIAAWRLEVDISSGKIKKWTFGTTGKRTEGQAGGPVSVRMQAIFEC